MKTMHVNTTRGFYLLCVIFFILVTLITARLGDIRHYIPCSTPCIAMDSFQNFQIKELYQNDATGYKALYTLGDEALRIEMRPNTTNREAQQSTQTQLTRLKSLYINAKSPYPGAASDEIVCNDALKPVFITPKNTDATSAYAIVYYNDRFTLGGCTKNQLVYRGIFSFLYCPNRKQLYQIELIAPTNTFNQSVSHYETIAHSIRCR